MSTAVAVHHGRFGRATLYRMNRPMTTHAHREGHLLFHVGGAPAALTVGRTRAPLWSERAVAVSPWQSHNFEPGLPGADTLCLILYIAPAWFLETSRSAQFSLHFGRPGIDITPRIRDNVARLSMLVLEQDPSDLLDGYLYELTRECFDQSWQWTPGNAQLAPHQSSFSDFRVRKSIRLMHERLSDTILIDHLARDAGLSRPHFFKLFKLQTGITPNLFLNTLRMESAIEDLVSSARTVTDISARLGFASQASFTRFFSANVGIAPSDYRRVAQLASC